MKNISNNSRNANSTFGIIHKSIFTIIKGEWLNGHLPTDLVKTFHTHLHCKFESFSYLNRTDENSSQVCVIKNYCFK